MDEANAQWIDDRTIPDSEGLWRRIYPSANHIVLDAKTNRWRPSSGAFIDQRGALSVHRASLTTVEQTLAGTPGYSLVEVKAEVFRARGYAVVPDPLPENPAHTLVRGKISKIHAREIAGVATWIVLHPPDAATDM
jgi:hypothetical protein